MPALSGALPSRERTEDNAARSLVHAFGLLERAGLVSRDASPDDLRAKDVRLTTRGRKRLDEILAAHANQIDQVLGGLSRAEQAELQRLLNQLGQHLRVMLESRDVEGLT